MRSRPIGAPKSLPTLRGAAKADAPRYPSVRRLDRDAEVLFERHMQDVVRAARVKR